MIWYEGEKIDHDDDCWMSFIYSTSSGLFPTVLTNEKNERMYEMICIFYQLIFICFFMFVKNKNISQWVL